MIRTQFSFDNARHDSYGTIKVNRSRELLKTDWKENLFDKIFTLSFRANCLYSGRSKYFSSLTFSRHIFSTKKKQCTHFVCVTEINDTFHDFLVLRYLCRFTAVIFKKIPSRWCLKITRTKVICLSNYMQVWIILEKCGKLCDS